MDTTVTPIDPSTVRVGDTITWGCQDFAYPVAEIHESHFICDVQGFAVDDGKDYVAIYKPRVSKSNKKLATAVRNTKGRPEKTPQADDQSQKADAGKSDPVLLEVDLADALAVVNRVLDYGKAKYGQRGGWKQVSMDRYDPAARRHRRARDTGEQFDTESGLDHMAHEITNLLFQLQTKIEQNPDIDFLTFNDPPQDHRKDI